MNTLFSISYGIIEIATVFLWFSIYLGYNFWLSAKALNLDWFNVLSSDKELNSLSQYPDFNDPEKEAF